jgi:hypothetical protein
MEKPKLAEPTIDAGGPRGDAGAGAGPADPSPDRRRGRRQRVLRSALIVFPGGYCTMPCHVLDTSDAGARLKPADIILCPREFVLKPLIGLPRDCEVVWRKGTTLGVRYL